MTERQPFSPLQRRAAGTKALLEAKIAEFSACVMSGSKAAAERARTEASAALDAHLDLQGQAIEEAIRQGF